MSQQHYQDQFKTVIGRGAWPGTLNVKVEGESLVQYKKLRVSAGLEAGESSSVDLHRIKGFDRDGVSFGGATAFLATIESEVSSHDCAVLIPDLTRHYDVVEIISSKLPLEVAINTKPINTHNDGIKFIFFLESEKNIGSKTEVNNG